MFNLAIPDRRYTFDVRRKPSTLGELVEADLLGFRYPSARQMFDHCHSATAMAPGEPWHSDINIERLPTMMGPTGLRLAFDQARAIVANGTYFDSHCWIFTPASFLELLRGATELGLVPFILSEFQPTEAGEFEFFATFRRPFAEAGPAMLEEMMEAIDVHRTALSRLADEQEVRQQRVQGEVARWRDEADLQHRRNMTLDHELSAAQARLMTLEGELRQVHLQAEVSHAAEQGAYLHALRAAYLQGEVHLRDAQIGMIRRSTSWRASWPLRVPRQLATVVLRHGPVGTMKHVARLLGYQAGRARRRLGRSGSDLSTQHAAIAADAAYTTAPVRSASEVVAPRVLILAELSIPQCAKYRVWQRAQTLARLGVPFTVIDWHRTAECRSALQTHALAIFYRVPAMPDVIGLLNEARRLNVTTYWEVDDLIFDEAAYLLNRNLDTLDPRLRAEVLAGIPLYSAALLACGRAIASTATLAEAMRAAGVDDVTVIENGLDDETIAFAEASRARRAEADPIGERSGVVIGYGSGSKAHDADFQQAAPAIAALMRARPDVRLRIMGELTLPTEIKAFSARVERLPFTGYASYLDRLAMCDISLVPLEATLFNDAKSNIKYVEAATLGLPSVCSPRSAFRDVVTHGRDGFIADTEAEWLEALTALVDSPALRRQVGATAHAHVLARYAPDVIARSQVEPLVRDLDRRTRKKLRVLAVNVFYWPQSYGGATIVAEELARRLHQRSDTEVFLFASQDQLTDPPHTFLRYADPTEGGDMPVIGVRMPHGHDAVLNFDNPEMLDRFREVLRAVEPDVVHFHCVQGISASILQACQDGGVPFVVTVHDA